MQKISHTVHLKLLRLILFKVYAVVTTTATAVGLSEATTIINHSTWCPPNLEKNMKLYLKIKATLILKLLDQNVLKYRV